MNDPRALATAVLRHLIDFVGTHRHDLLEGRVNKNTAHRPPLALTVGAVTLTIDAQEDVQAHAVLRVLLDRHAELSAEMRLDGVGDAGEDRLHALVEDFAMRDHEHVTPRPRFEIAFHFALDPAAEARSAPSSECVLELVALAVSLERALSAQPRAALTFKRQACSNGSV